MAYDGYVFVLRLGGTSVTGRTSSGLSKSWDMLDGTTADSSRAKEYLSGESGWTVSVEGKVGASDTYSITQLIAAGDTHAVVAALWGVLVDEGRRYSGNVFVSNVEVSAPVNGVVTFTCTLQGTGALSETTYTTT